MSHALVLVNIGTLDELFADNLAEVDPDERLTDLMAPYDENTEMPRYRRFQTRRDKGDTIRVHLLDIPKDYSNPIKKSGIGFSSDDVYAEKVGYDPRCVLPLRVPEPPEPHDLGALRGTNPSNEVWRAAVEANQAVREAYELALADAYTDEEVATAWNIRYADDGNDEKLFVAKDGYGSRPTDTIGKYSKASDGLTALYEWSRYNPQSKWDWYQIGGRWRGFFTVKEQPALVGAPGTGETVGERFGEWSVGGRTKELIEAKRADVALAGDIDWDGMREAYRKDVGDYYDEAARTRPDAPIDWTGPQDETPNKISREAYIERRLAEWDPSTLAILDEAEGWREGGQLGWFGAGYDDKDKPEWRRYWKEYVTNLDPNTVLVVVDYHI